jgi:hypothetical protein
MGSIVVTGAQALLEEGFGGVEVAHLHYFLVGLMQLLIVGVVLLEMLVVLPHVELLGRQGVEGEGLEVGLEGTASEGGFDRWLSCSLVLPAPHLFFL